MYQVYNEKHDCCGCSACYNGCPVKAIEMIEDSEGFKYPKIDEDICIDCNWCRRICPFLIADSLKEKEEKDFYYLKHNDENVLFNSTSGGAFSAISDSILEEGGIVYGAVFDENFVVKHIGANTLEEKNKMRKSKYSQSDLLNVFSEIKNHLHKGKKVMFSGTPCQVAGLKSYLDTLKWDKNLLLVDVICHSIPSPKVFRDYIDIIEKEEGKAITWIDFRYKDVPWTRDHSNRGFKYKLEGSDEIHSKDIFYDLFFKLKTITRPACEKCPFTDVIRVSDITIADYWGIEKYSKDLYDQMGVSSIMFNTDRGRDYLEKISNRVKVIKRDIKESLNEQQRLKEPIKYDQEKRKSFWEDYEKIGLEGIIRNL